MENKICDTCKLYADERCTCPTMPHLWGELMPTTIGNIDIIKQVAVHCTQSNMQDNTAIAICAPIIANYKQQCPMYNQID